jgi:hypothetical protein
VIDSVRLSFSSSTTAIKTAWEIDAAKAAIAILGMGRRRCRCPDTILRWHRDLMGRRHAKVSRPSVPADHGYPKRSRPSHPAPETGRP